MKKAKRETKKYIKKLKEESAEYKKLEAMVKIPTFDFMLKQTLYENGIIGPKDFLYEDNILNNKELFKIENGELVVRDEIILILKIYDLAKNFKENDNPYMAFLIEHDEKFASTLYDAFYNKKISEEEKYSIIDKAFKESEYDVSNFLLSAKIINYIHSDSVLSKLSDTDEN